MICQAKRGFFTLYDCPKESAQQCDDCGRKLCLEHQPKSNNFCLECVAKKKNTDEIKDPLVQSYSIRDTMMKDKEYKPIYLGKSISEYYSSYDIRAFDVELASIADMADSPDELFYDS